MEHYTTTTEASRSLDDLWDLLMDHRPAWQARAACQGLWAEVNFFPAKGDSPLPAKAVCAACPVKNACLEWALAQDHLPGVWGGLGEPERRRLRRRRAA